MQKNANTIINQLINQSINQSINPAKPYDALCTSSSVPMKCK